MVTGKALASIVAAVSATAFVLWSKLSSGISESQAIDRCVRFLGLLGIASTKSEMTVRGLGKGSDGRPNQFIVTSKAGYMFILDPATGDIGVARNTGRFSEYKQGLKASGTRSLYSDGLAAKAALLVLFHKLKTPAEWVPGDIKLEEATVASKFGPATPGRATLTMALKPGNLPPLDDFIGAHLSIDTQDGAFLFYSEHHGTYPPVQLAPLNISRADAERIGRGKAGAQVKVESVVEGWVRSANGRVARRCWKVTLRPPEPMRAQENFVDRETGQIIKREY